MLVEEEERRDGEIEEDGDDKQVVTDVPAVPLVRCRETLIASWGEQGREVSFAKSILVFTVATSLCCYHLAFAWEMKGSRGGLQSVRKGMKKIIFPKAPEEGIDIGGGGEGSSSRSDTE